MRLEFKKPLRPRFVVGALVFWGLLSCSPAEPPSEQYKAWYRPVPLGFCPRYLIEDRHAWVVGQVAPGKERPNIAALEFTFRGYFVKNDEGDEKTRSSCDDRPYPIFHLLEVQGERPMGVVDQEPKVLRGPGRVAALPDAGPKPVSLDAGVAAKPVPVKMKRAKKRKLRRRVKRRARSRRSP